MHQIIFASEDGGDHDSTGNKKNPLLVPVVDSPNPPDATGQRFKRRTGEVEHCACHDVVLEVGFLLLKEK